MFVFPPPFFPLIFFVLMCLSCSLQLYKCCRELIPFPFDGNAIMNMNTLLRFQFFDLSFIFATHIVFDKRNTKKTHTKKIDYYKWTNMCLQFSSMWLSFFFGVSVPPHAVYAFVLEPIFFRIVRFQFDNIIKRFRWTMNIDWSIFGCCV